MPLLYRSADCLLHLSRAEAFGNIYIEAAACGLPVVAHDSQLTRWILGKDGFFCHGEEQATIVEALRGALKAPADEEVGQVRHRTTADRFSWEVVGRCYADFFTKQLAQRNPES
jgi:glycosyltransferase involved in cell wall biosynthesis